MEDYFSSQEYKAKKREVVNKNIKAGIVGTVAGLAGLATLALGFVGISAVGLGSMAVGIPAEVAGEIAADVGLVSKLGIGGGLASLAGSAVSGVATFMLGIKAQQLGLDAKIDMEDLEAKRHAVHLQMAFGDRDMPKETLVAYEAGRRLADNTGKSQIQRLQEQQQSHSQGHTR